MLCNITPHIAPEIEEKYETMIYYGSQVHQVSMNALKCAEICKEYDIFFVSGVVIMATIKRVLKYDCVLLVKQYRPPIKACTLEFPAGRYFLKVYL